MIQLIKVQISLDFSYEFDLFLKIYRSKRLCVIKKKCQFT